MVQESLLLIFRQTVILQRIRHDQSMSRTRSKAREGATGKVTIPFICTGTRRGAPRSAAGELHRCSTMGMPRRAGGMKTSSVIDRRVEGSMRRGSPASTSVSPIAGACGCPQVLIVASAPQVWGGSDFTFASSSDGNRSMARSRRS